MATWPWGWDSLMPFSNRWTIIGLVSVNVNILEGFKGGVLVRVGLALFLFNFSFVEYSVCHVSNKNL